MLGFLSTLRKNARISRDRTNLASMPDHLLKDIGIGRSEIFYLTRSGREDHRSKK